MRYLFVILALLLGYCVAQTYTPPEVLKYKASWDRKKTAHVIELNQQAIANLNEGICEHDCVAFSECMVNILSQNMLYKDYEQYVEHPMRKTDMNEQERALDDKYVKLLSEVSGYCQAQRQAEKENNRFEKVVAYLDHQDAAQGNYYQWIPVNRSEDRLQQLDLSRIEKNADQRTFWVRQFARSFRGNYVLSQLTFSCSKRDQLIKRYSMLTKAGEEVLGDYVPDTMPIDVYGEDKELFKLVCPEEAALIKYKPEKKTGNFTATQTYRQ